MIRWAHNSMVETGMSTVEVAAFRARLQLNGYKVQGFEAGWAVELDGAQIWRATMTGADRFAVRYNEKMFPDV